MIGKYLIEEYAGIPVHVEYASDFRYRKPIVNSKTVVIGISQSGETADTLAALEYARAEKYVGIVTICNVPTSTMAREADWKIFTNAGPELGVASTKAFLGQMLVLYLLSLKISRERNEIDNEKYKNLILDLKKLPDY